jgi:hypothetical protein
MPDQKESNAMRIPFAIASIFTVAACAGAPSRPYSDDAVSGRWQGVLLRDGLRSPISVDFFERDRDWEGRFAAGSESVPLRDVRVTTTTVRFELPGEGVFEGSVAGDSIAGSVSGPVSGSFALTRHPDPQWRPYLFGP